MSENDRDGFEARFEEIAASFGTVSVQAQQGALYDVLAELEKERVKNGITAKIIDAAPLETISTITLHRLYHFNDPRGVIEEHFFHVVGTASDDRQTTPRPAYVNLPVSQTIRGIRYPQSVFDRYDAACVAEQVGRLDELKAVGVLPNLSPQLGFIIEPGTEIVLPPKK